MKVVIDIDETCWDWLRNGFPDEDDGEYAIKVIANGIPLPKGHGRLKDIDHFLLKVKADRKHSSYLRSWTADDVLIALDNSYASTVIEADKE